MIKIWPATDQPAISAAFLHTDIPDDWLSDCDHGVRIFIHGDV